MASELVNFGGFYYYHHLSAHRAPLYVIYLAVLMKYFGLSQNHYMFAFYLHILITSLFCFPVYALAKHIFSPRVAVISVLVLISDWYVITLNYLLLPEVFLTGVILLLLINLYKIEKFQRKRFAVCCGALFGIGTLLRGVLLCFFPVALLWVSSRGSIPVRKRITYVLLIGMITALTLAPWTIRNYFVFKKLVFGDTTLGYNLWFGNNEKATGGFAGSDGEKWVPMPKSLVEQTKGMNEAERSEYLIARALDFIKTHPKEFLILRLKSLFYFWFTYNYWHEFKVVFAEVDSFFLKFPREGLVLFNLLLVIGLYTAIKDRKDIFLIAGLAAAFSLLYSLFHADAMLRYCAPLHPALTLFVGNALNKLYGWFSTKRLNSEGETFSPKEKRGSGLHIDNLNTSFKTIGAIFIREYNPK
jgi:hypothetical protein